MTDPLPSLKPCPHDETHHDDAAHPHWRGDHATCGPRQSELSVSNELLARGRDRRDHTIAELRAEIERLTACTGDPPRTFGECDPFTSGGALCVQCADRLRAECERMRPVVEAVREAHAVGKSLPWPVEQAFEAMDQEATR